MQEDVYQGNGLNLYAYCHNNPVVYYDPSGYVCGETGEIAGDGGGTVDFYITPEGVAIPRVYYHSLSDLEVRKWYLSQEATIPNLIDYNQPLKQQAYQAFFLRNSFRTAARELMADRKSAESLYKTDPNLTWEGVVQKQAKKGLTGDDIYNAIVQSSQRSRKSVNKSLGLE